MSIEIKLSRDRKSYEINIPDRCHAYGFCRFVLTVNQMAFVKEYAENIRLWKNSANKKYQIAVCTRAFMCDGKQIPKNAIIVFDRADMLWICSSFAFTVKVDKEGKRKRCMLPKKYLKYMHVSCYTLDTCMWEDTTLGRGSLMFNIHDAIASIGVNHVEYDNTLRETTQDEYSRMMKDCIRRRKHDSGGRRWDNPYAIADKHVFRGYTDESHWTGIVGSMIANNMRYA